MAVPAQTSEGDEQKPWDAILRQTESAVEKNTDPNAWALEVISTLDSSGVTLPSVDLAQRLVSHFFWDNHSPIAWKLLHTAASLNIIPPLLLLALLSTRSFYIFVFVCFCFYCSMQCNLDVIRIRFSCFLRWLDCIVIHWFCFFLFDFCDCRVVSSRQLYPAAYRLYMELLKLFGFKLESHISSPNYEMWGPNSDRYESVFVFSPKRREIQGA